MRHPNFCPHCGDLTSELSSCDTVSQIPASAHSALGVRSKLRPSRHFLAAVVGGEGIFLVGGEHGFCRNWRKMVTSAFEIRGLCPAVVGGMYMRGIVVAWSKRGKRRHKNDVRTTLGQEPRTSNAEAHTTCLVRRAGCNKLLILRYARQSAVSNRSWTRCDASQPIRCGGHKRGI